MADTAVETQQSFLEIIEQTVKDFEAIAPAGQRFRSVTLCGINRLGVETYAQMRHFEFQLAGGDTNTKHEIRNPKQIPMTE